MKTVLNRRRFMRALGLGAGSLCLPSLYSRGAAAQATAPSRVLFFVTPHGTVPGRWQMRQPGQDAQQYEYSLNGVSAAEFSDVLRPLHRHRNKLTIVDGLARMVTLDEEHYNANGGSGDNNRHHIGQAHLMTSRWAWQGENTARGGGISIDQEIGNAVSSPGQWNSRVYGFNHQHPYSYVASNQPSPRESSANSAFGDITGLAPEPSDGEPSRESQIRASDGSILDMAASQFESAMPNLSNADRQKLEQHRQLIRDLEVAAETPPSFGCEPTFASNGHIIDQFSRLATVALSCNLSRVVTLVAQNIPSAEFGVDPGVDMHQDIAHASNEDGGTTAGIEGMVNYNNRYAEHFANLLDQLDAVQEGNGTLLDNTTVLWITELGTGGHMVEWVPAIVAGGGAGHFSPGRYVHYPRNRTIEKAWGGSDTVGLPFERLYVNVMHSMGMTDRDHFGATETTSLPGTPISLRNPLPLL